MSFLFVFRSAVIDRLALVSIALPWMRLRKYKIQSEVLSNHCVRIYFDYGKLTGPQQVQIDIEILTSDPSSRKLCSCLDCTLDRMAQLRYHRRTRKEGILHDH